MPEDSIIVTRGDSQKVVWSSLTGWHDGKPRYILRSGELNLLAFGAFFFGMAIGIVAMLGR